MGNNITPGPAMNYDELNGSRTKENDDARVKDSRNCADSRKGLYRSRMSENQDP